MIAEYSRRSVYWCVPGFVIQIGGVVLGAVNPSPTFMIASISLILMYGGAAILGVGLGWLTKSKGHSKWWGFLSLFSIVGVLVVLAIQDRTVANVPKFCQECGYDLRGILEKCPECGTVH